MSERKKGVSASVESMSPNTEGSVTITLQKCAEDAQDSIYNLIFRKYDEENTQ